MEKHNRSRLAASDDMISSLPDDLLSRILSLLPTSEAVATSVLSKRWKFAWTGVTSLMFLDRGCATKESITSFAQFVNTVLDRHHCNYLNQFELISATNERIHRQSSQKVDFNRCFTYAVSRNVGAIRFETPALGHIIPPALFTCATLESLHLRGPFMVQVLPSVVSLPKLQAMILSRLRYESEDYVEKLISSCSVLRTLDIELFRGVYTVSSSSLRTLQLDSGRSQVVIDAPNVDYLYINNSSWEGRDSITIKRLAFSSTVKLVFVEEDHRILNNDCQMSYGYKCIVQLVESVSQYVKYLTINGLVMKALSHSTTPLSASFPCLTRLDICSRFWDWNSLCVSVMLVKSIKLQALNVELFRSDVNKSAKFSRKCWEDPEQVPECLSSSLEQISFSGFRGFKDEMAMLKYVLNHGAVLKSVNIFSPDSSKYQMELEQVSMFPRLCPSCQLYLSHDT